MRMIPIYDSLLMMLGHIEMESYIDAHDHIKVMEDVSLRPYDPSVKVIDPTTSYCAIPKKEMEFRNDWDEQTRHFLVIEHRLPDWFWKNKGCVELKLDNLKRIRW